MKGGEPMFVFLVAMLLQAPELRGEYLCHGYAADGSYDLLLTIEKREENYLVIWKTNEVKAKGLGIRHENDLAVLIVGPQGTGGIALYRITKGGLEGIWAVGDGRVYTETCSVGPPSRA